MIAPDKTVLTAQAVAAIQGMTAEPSRDERGRRTIILTRGAWTREVPVAQLREVLSALKCEAAPGNDLDMPTGKRANAAFRTLVAQLAQEDIRLWRTDPDDGAVQYFIAIQGELSRYDDLEEVVEQFAAARTVFRD